MTRTERFELTERTRPERRATRIARAPSRVQTSRRGRRRVVRDPDRLRLVVERDHRRDRSEDLLARDAVVVPRLDERAGEPEPWRVGRIAAEERLAVDEAEATVSRCAAEISGPISVASSRGIADPDAAVAAIEQLDEPLVDRALDEDALARAAVLAGVVEDGVGAAAAARSRSASAKMTFADLPPSSSETRLIVAAAPCITSAPDLVEPVKAILATSGCSTSACPTTRAPAGDDVEAPPGMPASSASSREPQGG